MEIKKIYNNLSKPVKLLSLFLICVIFFLSLSYFILYLMVQTFTLGLPSITALEEGVSLSVGSKIFASDGTTLLYKFSSENRQIANIDEIPQKLIDAFLVVEDQNFYNHWGISLSSLLRATIANLSAGRIVQGGSTISQQLARNLFLNREVSYGRKIKEAILTLEIEYNFSKDEILELYLNKIPLGNRSFGIKSAAKRYFNKNLEELTNAECALLAGLPKGPTRYSPKRAPERAKKRRNVILKMMFNNNIISHEELLVGLKEEINLSENIDVFNYAPYFVEYTRKILEKKYSRKVLYNGGLRIITTLDIGMQLIAEETLKEKLLEMEQKNEYEITKENYLPEDGDPQYLQGAILCIEPNSGEIKAYVGGRDYRESNFDNISLAHRQPGSSFKPFTYLTALKKGYTAASVIKDTPVIQEEPYEENKLWRPKNYDGRFMGAIPLRTGLALSRNIIAIRLIKHIGVKNVIKLAKDFGITTPIPPYNSISIGSNEVQMLELVNAYNTFASYGLHFEPLAVKQIYDNNGALIFEGKYNFKEVETQENVALLINLLESVINNGTGRGIRRREIMRPVAGKTGTTDECYDAWFIGFIPQLTCGVWVGFPSPKTMGTHMSGATVALPIWADFMKEVVENVEVKEFTLSEKIITKLICPKTGLLAGSNCPIQKDEIFVIGTEPEEQCEHKDDSIWYDNDGSSNENIQPQNSEQGNEPRGF